MLEILNTVYSLLKKQKVVFDTISNQLVYRLVFACLIAFSAMAGLREFSSEHMSCVTGRASFEKVVDNYCNTLGTFTYPPPSDKTLWAINVIVSNSNLRKPRLRLAEAYPGVYPYEDEEPERIYNTSSVFLPIYFLVMAVSCCFPQLWWRKRERKLMLHLVQELNQPSIDENQEDKKVESSGRHFYGSKKEHKRYAVDYLMLHIFNATLLLTHLFVLYYVVDTDFIFYGYEALKYLDVPAEKRPHGLARRFTLAAKCDFRHWSQTADLTIDHAICVIHLNKVYQLLLGLYWWALCLALMVTLTAAFSHALKISYPALRRMELRYLLRAEPNSEEGKAIKNLNFGSGFVVFMLCKNVEYHVVKKILAEVSYYPDD